MVKEYVRRPVRNIVFPNTMDIEQQEALVRRVKNLQDFFKAQLHLVWINTPLNFTSDPITTARLKAFAERYKLKNYAINIFNYTDEERGILEFSNSIKGDLVAIGTHGRKGVAHLVNGSLAEDIANHYKGLVWTYALRTEQEA